MSLNEDRLLDQPSYFVEEFLSGDPFKYQSRFMDADSSRKAFCAGRRVGKSRTASWIALWKAITFAGSEILITAKTQRQSMELFNQIKKEIRRSKIDEGEWGITRENRTHIELSNGSRIICLPVGRDGSNIRGYGADLLIVDEAAFISDSIFQEVLSPMLAVGDGTFILISTPKGKRGFFWDKVENDDGWYTERVQTSANPLIDDSFIKEQRRNLTSTQFKQEILGEFSETDNAFFTKKELDKCTSSQVVDRDSRVAYLGVDVAATGDDESVYISIDADGNVYNVEHTSENTLTESISRIKTLDGYNDYAEIMVDSTGLGRGVVDQLQEDIGNKVSGFSFTNEKKQSLYNTLKNELQEGNLSFYHVPGKNDLDEVKMYDQMLDLEKSYTAGGKLKIEAPSNGHDDFSDALALAVWAKSQKSMARSDDGSMQPFSLGSLR